MSDNTTESTNGTVEQAGGEAATAESVTDWRAHARAWEDRSKANHAKVQELQPLADRAQELEKALAEMTEKYAAANERVTALEPERDRLAVIAKHGIPEEFHDLVQGGDADALNASAEKVRALVEKSSSGGGSYVVPAEGGAPALALNGDGIENALKNALGII